MPDAMRIIRCPVCGFSVTAPADADLPDEGPSCAMGHEETPMEIATVRAGHG